MLDTLMDVQRCWLAPLMLFRMAWIPRKYITRRGKRRSYLSLRDEKEQLRQRLDLEALLSSKHWDKAGLREEEVNQHIPAIRQGNEYLQRKLGAGYLYTSLELRQHYDDESALIHNKLSESKA
jgi:hypothetical protein